MTYDMPEVITLGNIIEAIKGSPGSKPSIFCEGGSTPLTTAGAYEADD